MSGWAKGIKFTKEHREKLSIARKGRHFPKLSQSLIGLKSKEKHWKWNGGLPKCIDCNKQLGKYGAKRCTRCNGELRKRDKNHNWKGGITPINTKIRNSIEYIEWRTNVFKRDDYTCINCGVRGVKFRADHIKPFSRYPKLRFELSNGRTLCLPCDKELGWSLFKSDNPNYWTKTDQSIVEIKELK